jgi:putative endonuclease
MPRRGSPTGQHWEDVAREFIECRGVRVLKSSYSCRFGEIDLIGRHHDELVFIEVKARRASCFGSALAGIGRDKKLRILKTANHFLMRNPQLALMPSRIDVVAIDSIDTGEPKIQWVKNAFDST